MKVSIFLFVLLFSTLSHAGTYILTDGKIDQISSTSGNLDEFVIWTSGGSGPCVGKGIKFTLADSGGPGVFDKAYSMALAAFAANFKVTVHNYHDDSCNRASYIQIER